MKQIKHKIHYNHGLDGWVGDKHERVIGRLGVPRENNNGRGMQGLCTSVDAHKHILYKHEERTERVY